MRDPLPENIDGQKVHVVKHDLQWGYLVWGVIALIVILWLWSRTNESEDAEEVQSPV